MKKSALALGVVVALGTTWTGGAWYTGKVAETEFARQVDIANKDLNKSAYSLGLDIRFDNVSFERGLFSSKTKYKILVAELDNPGKTWTLPFEGTLYHGPLPLNQLSHFNFMPSMFSSVDFITKNETTTPWFDATKGKTPVMLTTSVGYNQSGSSKVELVPFEASMKDGTLAANGFDVKFGFVREGINKLDLDLAKLVYSKSDSKDSIELNDVKIDVDYRRIPEWEYIPMGKKFLSGGVIKINGTDAEGKTNNVEFQNWKIDFDTVRKDQFLDFGAKIAFNGMTIRGISFGDLTIDSAFNHVDGETFNQLIQVYTEAAKKPQEEFAKAKSQAAKKFFDTQPQFIFSPALTNQAGKLASNLDISIASSDFENSISKGKIFNLFNHFIFKVDANKDALIEEVANALQLKSPDKEQAMKMAATQVNEGVKNGVLQGVLVEDGKQVKLDLVLEKGQLKLNGQVIPEEQVASILFLAAMSMGH
ncbi:YdgA family protein [Aggregatibacter actinomycetemcomitans]|uniref:YdgA family protein n=1 Tax=Aggregatibacter actinomycetemcomitans TaxID=714 RepID=UPI00197BC513|nr:YdgA family protein [Aggregatibacter actinomycetemcomitans]MBN6077315.1 YdgA family protein [Aggregatibacter actinomycetemcomitans]